MKSQRVTLALSQAVERNCAATVALSDDLAAHPELPDQEFRSSRKIVKMLEQAGYQVEYPYLGYPTGFHAVLDNGEGPSAAILVEYDALPGLGHACGHNVHGSMAVLAALAMVAASAVFSWFIGMSSRYALVYGSLVSIIILLVWLYFCGQILFLGIVFTSVWYRRRPDGKLDLWRHWR